MNFSGITNSFRQCESLILKSFRKALISKADFDAGKCDGDCLDGCAKMGYYAEKPENPGSYYGDTGKREPFCGRF